MIEEWCPIPGYEGLYEVSSTGRVRSLDRVVSYVWRGRPKVMSKAGTVLAPEIDDDGYFRVRLFRNGNQQKFGIHQLVALAFIANPDGLPEVAHIDHNRRHNRPSNLKWASRPGNHTDSVIENRYSLAGPNLGRKRTFTADEIRSIRSRFASGDRQVDIAHDLGIRQEQVRKIVSRERWGHID